MVMEKYILQSLNVHSQNICIHLCSPENLHVYLQNIYTLSWRHFVPLRKLCLLINALKKK